MNDDPVAAILSRIDTAQELYHRLIFVVGPSGSGKTATLRALAAHVGAPVLNLNVELPVAHGGITLEEVVVPLVRIDRK